MHAPLPVFTAAVDQLTDWIAATRVLQLDPAQAADLLAAPGQAWDLVVIGGGMETRPKSAGIDLLNALVYRSAWLLVVTSEFVVHEAGGLVSAWSERDHLWHDLWAWDNCRATTLAVLRGYRPSAMTLAGLVDRVNQAAVPVHDFDGRGFVRPLRLRLVELPREVSYRPA